MNVIVWGALVVGAQDKGGLVPLHNACSYGHHEVTELLIRAGANVNAGNGIGVANSFGVGINLPGAGIQQSFGNSQTTAQNFRPRPQPFGK